MRNVYVLSLAQALSAAGMMTIFLLGGIIGSELAPLPQIATLPVSLTVVGLAVTAIPAALIMERIGRRNAFIASALLAAVAALAVAWAVVQASFWLLCAATLVLGANLAFQQQQRFAAAESVPPGKVSQAVSMVMIGTLVAAAIGPQIALALKDLVPGHEYAGSFIGVAALCIAAAITLAGYSPPPAHAQTSDSHDARPLPEVVRQPLYLIAVGAAVVSYAVMSFIMTATPISMHVHDHHSDADTAWVIQSHLLAMYGPSLVSGRLIGRIGARAGMTAGALLMLACVAIASAGHDLMHYWWGLVLLGIGWNLLFVAGTALLTTTYRPAERFRAQAVNEFSVFGTQALASLLAGPAIHALGWRTLNFAALAPLLLFGLALLAWPGQRSRNSRA
ncbi:MAG TPA: MFS transporter [Steroidobacteraceae bacterium]|nr:MFS transporter [Steroidobacteraceae bacterium]